MNTPRLETERLILRKFTEDDIEALFLILKDEEVNKFLPWCPLKNLEEAKNFYEERYTVKYAEPQAYAYAICLKKDNVPIGYVNVAMEEHLLIQKTLKGEIFSRSFQNPINFVIAYTETLSLLRIWFERFWLVAFS